MIAEEYPLAKGFLSEEASPPTRTNGAGATCLRRSAGGSAWSERVLLRESIRVR